MVKLTQTICRQIADELFECLAICGIGTERVKWDKVFKNGPNKNSGRQPLKNLKGYGMLLWNLRGYGIHS